MWLADSSIWIDHFRKWRPDLAERLSQGQVVTHSCVMGELALGNLQRRPEVMSHLAALPRAVEAQDDEVMFLIEQKNLWGIGVGWVDVQLLASAVLTGCRLWTLDKKLAALCERFKIA